MPDQSIGRRNDVAGNRCGNISLECNGTHINLRFVISPRSRNYSVHPP
uniref:Uncharacterized protein n=1 Tax=Anopheles atroparvus TaxID=41427 RepID=A0AAG5DKT5_ANOAO